jgi:hypothetical protein
LIHGVEVEVEVEVEVKVEVEVEVKVKVEVEVEVEVGQMYFFTLPNRGALKSGNANFFFFPLLRHFLA